MVSQGVFILLALIAAGVGCKRVEIEDQKLAVDKNQSEEVAGKGRNAFSISAPKPNDEIDFERFVEESGVVIREKRRSQQPFDAYYDVQYLFSYWNPVEKPVSAVEAVFGKADRYDSNGLVYHLLDRAGINGWYIKFHTSDGRIIKLEEGPIN